MKEVTIVCHVEKCYECPLLERRFFFWWECTNEWLPVSRSDLDTFPAFCDLEEVVE